MSSNTGYDYYIYNTLTQIRDILQLGFAKEIIEENLRLAEHKVSKENFVKQILDYTDELISEGELEQSQKHVGTRVSTCLTRAGITSFEEYDNWGDKELVKIRNFGGRTLEAATKIRAWHERKHRD
jgi:DNA-directed RNA polymerase alpha subunit